AWVPKTFDNTSLTSKVFSANFAGVVSLRLAPNLIRSKGKLSTSMRGIPKLIFAFEFIWLKAKRVKLARASFNRVADRVRIQVKVRAVLRGLKVRSSIERLSPAESLCRSLRCVK